MTQNTKFMKRIVKAKTIVHLMFAGFMIIGFIISMSGIFPINMLRVSIGMGIGVFGLVLCCALQSFISKKEWEVLFK